MSGVNLKRIAEAAGVSLATASRVLSGSAYPVKDGLRKRVLAAAEELHYVPNAAAQGLLRGRSRTIGVLVGDVGDPYFSGMAGGIHSYADEIDHMVMIINTYRDPEGELQAFRRLHGHRVDVMIVAGSGLDHDGYCAGLAASVAAFTRGGGAVVVVGRHELPSDLRVCRVSVENRSGARLIAEHLTSLGHRRVALLTGDPRLNSTADRMSGFRDVLGDEVVPVHVEPTRDGGHAGAMQVVGAHSDVTAIAATADQMAYGALVALREQGIEVPGDMSVAGFNDISMSRDLVPALTSVHVPLWEMGRQASLLGHHSLDGEPGEVTMDVTLMVRGSTGPPPIRPA